ncbi:MAG: hypothetical protein ACYS6W_04195 [Planctomycetota bacterium]|jgi:hypothetical protein
MKRPAQKAFLLAVGIVLITLIAGCEEEEKNLPDTKRSRLIAAENMRLEKALKQRDNEIESQKELLEKCLKDKNAWKKKSQQNVQEQVDRVLTVVMETNQKLREENEKLKVQIEQLEKELEEAQK